jgi:hypothetical protein
MLAWMIISLDKLPGRSSQYRISKVFAQIFFRKFISNPIFRPEIHASVGKSFLISGMVGSFFNEQG